MNLTLNEVGYRTDDKQIIDDVSLELQHREFLALIGPNGSGKSTTIRCAADLLSPTAGTVRLGGRPTSEMDRKTIARTMAVVGQEMPVNFDFSVREIVTMGRAPHKSWFTNTNDEDRTIVRNALQKVGMEDFADRAYGTLSGGEQQRVLIARCLAQQAEVLLLDEPTNHLDVRYTLDFLDLIDAFEGSVLIAMHDLNLAAQYADRIVVLEDGGVVETGPPDPVIREDLIEDVFGRSVSVGTEPQTERPQVTYLPGKEHAH